MMEEGKLSLDLLIGLSIFLFTFIFIANFLPGVFADVRNEIGLMHESYRLGVILAEMEGFWRDSSGNGTNWHEKTDKWNDPDFYFFPGLTKGKADYLDYYKIRAFKNLVESNYDLVREVLGLKTMDREYHFNVSLESLDSTTFSPIYVRNMSSGESILVAGKPIPPSGYVARYERFVWIDPYKDLAGVFNIGTGGPNMVPKLCKIEETDEDKKIYCTLVYPIKTFTISVVGKIQDNSVWKIGICLYDEKVASCAANPNKIQIYYGQSGAGEGEATYDIESTTYYLAGDINRILKEKGYKVGDEFVLSYGAQNVKATLYVSDSVAIIAGKAAAKLVINVW